MVKSQYVIASDSAAIAYFTGGGGASSTPFYSLCITCDCFSAYRRIAMTRVMYIQLHLIPNTTFNISIMLLP
jgi:hypothetical protein